MRKVALGFLILLLMGSLAFATVRGSFSNPTGDGTVTSTDTIIVDANIYYKGVTVGDKVELKKGSSTGAVICTVVADTANGNKKCFSGPEKVMVDGGVYMDATISGGIAGMNLLYQ